MRLYHPHLPRASSALVFLILINLCAACVSPQATQSLITVSIIADGNTSPVYLAAGSTVQQALDTAMLSLNTLDRTEPPVYTVLSNGASIRIIRVTEKFEVEQVIIPYEQQVLRNESLPKDQKMVIQAGDNGLQEITYRRVYEDGVEVSSQPIPVKVVTIKEPVAQILMVGVPAPFAPVSIPGRLIYLRDGNVWMIEGTTGNRKAALATGDLDGRIFSLSSDGTWLLFTRRATEKGQINSLWATNIVPGSNDNEEGIEGQVLVDLKVSNVIHFADWVPGSKTKIIFSTVEPRSAAPGWQANNDLNALTFSTTGWTTKWTVILEPNAGGVYGWWGSNFVWAPDGVHLAYARPGSIGLLNYKDGSSQTIYEIIPLLTRRDWAWVPGLSWGPDGAMVYTVDHVPPPGSVSPEESQLFDLTVIPAQAGPSLHLVPQSGMFAYPIASPLQTQPSGETGYQIAYLQAIFPDQSETSRYRLAVMDRDGSNRQVLFPSQEVTGLEPQSAWGAWSPASLPESGNYSIAVLYQGNLWLVDSLSGEATQLTSDGLTTRVIWE